MFSRHGSHFETDDSSNSFQENPRDRHVEIAQTRSPRLVEGRPSVRVCAPVRDERDFDACASTARGMRRAAGWCTRTRTAGSVMPLKIIKKRHTTLSYQRPIPLKNNQKSAVLGAIPVSYREIMNTENASVQIIHSFYKLCCPYFCYFRDDLRRGRKAYSVVSSMAQWSGYGQASLQCKLLLFAVIVSKISRLRRAKGQLEYPFQNAPPRRSATSGTYPLYRLQSIKLKSGGA